MLVHGIISKVLVLLVALKHCLKNLLEAGQCISWAALSLGHVKILLALWVGALVWLYIMSFCLEYKSVELHFFWVFLGLFRWLEDF